MAQQDVSNVRVSIESLGITGTTDSNGNCSFEVPPGTYNVKFEHDDYETKTVISVVGNSGKNEEVQMIRKSITPVEPTRTTYKVQPFVWGENNTKTTGSKVVLSTYNEMQSVLRPVEPYIQEVTVGSDGYATFNVSALDIDNESYRFYLLETQQNEKYARHTNDSILIKATDFNSSGIASKRLYVDRLITSAEIINNSRRIRFYGYIKCYSDPYRRYPNSERNSEDLYTKIAGANVQMIAYRTNSYWDDHFVLEEIYNVNVVTDSNGRFEIPSAFVYGKDLNWGYWQYKFIVTKNGYTVMNRLYGGYTGNDWLYSNNEQYESLYSCGMFDSYDDSFELTLPYLTNSSQITMKTIKFVVFDGDKNKNVPFCEILLTATHPTWESVIGDSASTNDSIILCTGSDGTIDFDVISDPLVTYKARPYGNSFIGQGYKFNGNSSNVDINIGQVTNNITVTFTITR